MGARVTRFDTIRLDKAAKLSSGALRVDGTLTRVGVFEYRDAAGAVVREYRPPDEVFNADSVASMADVDVTIGHPRGMVEASNWRQLSVGHVSGVPHKDEAVQGLAAPVVVKDPEAIKRIDSKGPDALRDISAGYTVELDPTPGITPDGKPYDVVQRNIRYNHVALLKRGDGRQGTQVGLRLDGAGHEICTDEIPCEGERVNMKIMLKVDGKAVEVEAGSAEHLNAQAKIDAAHDAALVEANKRADAAEKAAKEATDKLAAIEAKAKADARKALETTAKDSRLLGAEAKFDGKSDRDVMVAVVLKHDATFNPEGRDDSYVAARFDIACAALTAAPSGGKQADLARDLSDVRGDKKDPKAAPRFDAKNPPDITTDPHGYAEWCQWMAANAWR